jgi:hypothetical protein
MTTSLLIGKLREAEKQTSENYVRIKRRARRSSGCLRFGNSSFVDISDNVRKSPFHFAELGDAKPDEEAGNEEAEGESG